MMTTEIKKAKFFFKQYNQLFTVFILSALFTISACSNELSQRNQVIEDYETARKIFWNELYPEGGETLYCGKRFGGGYNRGINIEHVFPMGWVTYSLKCGKRKQCRNNSPLFNQIEADLHNLYPARSDINQERSSIAFGMVNGEKRHYGTCDFEVQHHRPRLVEPREQVRGNIARSMFYMAETYELMLFDKQVAVLNQWHKADPPDQPERSRNDKIEKIQGNRNPYIDGKNF
jgi:deoxyribonuclease-1